MNEKKMLCLALASCFLGAKAWAQNPTEHIQWDDKRRFSDVYYGWDPGQPLYPGVAEDENFFISRVKIRPRFYHQATQIDKTLTEATDKRILNWVPIGQATDGRPNALPSGIFDSDVFSIWSYMTHWGNWTAPLVRMPGAFADAAHKNGVSVSVLASVPNAGLPEEHKNNFYALIRGKGDKFIKLLNQYGIDGWGVNSEFSTSRTVVNDLQGFMIDAYKEAIKNKKLPSYALVWYTGVNDRGGISFVDGLASGHNTWFDKDGNPLVNYLFGNYNWGERQMITNSNTARDLNRDVRDVYAGINQQSGNGAIQWTLLKKYPTSIGLWGAHNMNMFYESRGEQGAKPEVQQMTYLTRIERFWSNGHQNPAKSLPIKNALSTFGVEALKSFHGMSAFGTAKSTLSWSLDDEPFFSYFNLGNGRFFNIDGKTVRRAEWYNLGMQDYLPTWRYWFAKSVLGTGEQASLDGLKASFTWEDAWFGGSSLKIMGSTETEYLHLFKTRYQLKEGDVITVRYKVLSGEGTVSLFGLAEGQESQEVSTELLEASEVEADEWLEAKITVKNSGRNSLALAGKTLALLGLKFEDADKLNLLIGEISIVRNKVAEPAMPKIVEKPKFTQIVKYSYKGLDIKVNFEMERPASMADALLVYNSDVKTSFFKVYVKQGNGTPKFLTATTSWAALAYNVPYVDGAGDVKIGVSAVGLDGKTESSIAWSSALTIPAYAVSDAIAIDKPVIKPGQSFQIKLVDDKQQEAKWEIKSPEGKTTFSAMGKSIETSIDKVGLYDLVVTMGGQAKTYSGYVQISDPKTGAVPEIKQVTFGGQAVPGTLKATEGKPVVVAYEAKDADGRGSRGLNLREKPVGVAMQALDLKDFNKPFTFSFWVKFAGLPQKPLNLFNVRNVGWDWPENNWGQLWAPYFTHLGVQDIARRQGFYNGVPEDHIYYKYDISLGLWMHFTYVFEPAAGGVTIPRLYINGKKVGEVKKMSGDQYVPTNPKSSALKIDDTRWASAYFYIGGATRDWAGVDGVVDDVKYYDRALDEAEVKTEMLSDNAEADGLKGFWNFEEDQVLDKGFVNKAINGPKEAYLIYGQQQTISGEGRTKIVYAPANWEAGSPFLSGTNYQVETKPTWSFAKATLSDQKSDKTSGSVKVTYKKSGVFTGMLTLTNSWGTATKLFEGITVASSDNVEMTDEISLAAFPNPFVETMNIRFAAAGAYKVSIFDLSGTLVSSQAVEAEAGGIVTVNLDAPAGIYLLRVQTAEGKLLQTVKLQKK